jgi:hypothetical protein
MSLRRNDEAIANYAGSLCIVCDCHAIARNDMFFSDSDLHRF